MANFRLLDDDGDEYRDPFDTSDIDDLEEQERITENIKAYNYKTKLSISHPLQVLSELITLWPPQDVRLTQNGWASVDDEMMTDIRKGMKVSIRQVDLTNNILEEVVEFQNNMDEFERYNIVAAEHNKQWIENGCPTEYIEPSHGDIIPIKNQYAPHATVDNIDPPKPSDGPLASKRPTTKRNPYIRIVYQLTINKKENTYTLGYVAYDYKGLCIYYNNVTHKDLKYLVRRATQELWGNHNAKEEAEALLDGIPGLMQGAKIPVCIRDNTRPPHMPPNVTLKKNNPDLQRAKTIYSLQSFFETCSGYIVPIIVAIGILWSSFHFLAIYNDLQENAHVGLPYLSHLISYVLLVLFSRGVSAYLSRRVTALQYAMRFM